IPHRCPMQRLISVASATRPPDWPLPAQLWVVAVTGRTSADEAGPAGAAKTAVPIRAPMAPATVTVRVRIRLRVFNTERTAGGAARLAAFGTRLTRPAVRHRAPR